MHETVINESDSKGKDSGLESSIKPREFLMNTNSTLVNWLINETVRKPDLQMKKLYQGNLYQVKTKLMISN